MIFGYVRVSTTDQDLDAQFEALRAAVSASQRCKSFTDKTLTY